MSSAKVAWSEGLLRSTEPQSRKEGMALRRSDEKTRTGDDQGYSERPAEVAKRMPSCEPAAHYN